VAVLVSTEIGRVVGVLAMGSIIAASLWVAHLRTEGVVWLLATVASLGVASLTVAFGVTVLVEGRTDALARARLVRLLRPGATEAPTKAERCLLCRRPLVTIDGIELCTTCDQRPTP
jgi:hypothetical protein